MILAPWILSFMIYSDNHIINYVTRSTFHRFRKFVDYHDVKYETIVRFKELQISSPLDTKDQKMKNLFSAVSRYARRERQNALRIRQTDYIDIERYFFDRYPIERYPIERYPPFDRLNDQEMRICALLYDGIDLYDILCYERLSFVRFQKIKKKCKQKLMILIQSDRRLLCFEQLKSEYIF